MSREIIQKVNDTTIIAYDGSDISGYRFMSKKGNSVYFSLVNNHPNQPILVEREGRFAPVIIAVGQNDINEHLMLQKMLEEE